jgi:hypothetical protein
MIIPVPISTGNGTLVKVQTPSSEEFPQIPVQFSEYLKA